MADCKSCSRPILGGERFCTNCGADQIDPAPIDASSACCSNCNANLTEEDRFCTACGHPVLQAANEIPASARPTDIDQDAGSISVSALADAGIEAQPPQADRLLNDKVLTFIKSHQVLLAISLAAATGWIFLDTVRAVGGKTGFAVLMSVTAAMAVSWPIVLFDLQLSGLTRAFKDQADGPFADRFLTFLARHKALLTISVFALLGWTFSEEVIRAGGDWGFAVLAAMTAALTLSWPVALIRTPRTLEIVHGVDGFIGDLSDRAAGSDSRIGRWAIYPVMFLGIGAASLSRFARDEFAAASIRVFCYVLTIAAIVSLVFLAIVFVIAMFVLWAALWIIGLFLGDEAATPKMRLPRNVVAKRGRNQIIHEGNSWLNERRAGRVDEKGNIYEGDNWFNEKKVGRIDEDGRVFEGENWFSEKQVGRSDKDGNIYEGDSWFNENKVGRADEDGNIYEGDNWFNEKKIGRTEDKD